jgi:hypothetical protein
VKAASCSVIILMGQLDVEIEFESWQLACGSLKDKSCDSLSSLDVCNALMFSEHT